jgi:hypothetical protein
MVGKSIAKTFFMVLFAINGTIVILCFLRLVYSSTSVCTPIATARSSPATRIGGNIGASVNVPCVRVSAEPKGLHTFFMLNERAIFILLVLFFVVIDFSLHVNKEVGDCAPALRGSYCLVVVVVIVILVLILILVTVLINVVAIIIVVIVAAHSEKTFDLDYA